MELGKNVALLPVAREGMGNLNLVLAWDDAHLVLVDAGVPGMGESIAAAIKAAGHDASKLTHLILTHQDWDHVGSVAELRKIAPALRVLAHEEEAPYIDGRATPIKLAARLAQYPTMTDEQKAGVDRWKNLLPIPIDQEVRDKQVLTLCGGIEIIHVPGHTPGHIAVYFRESSILAVGDAANVRDGALVGSNPIHTHDAAQADASLEKIKAVGARGIVAYHTGYLEVIGHEAD